jgi:hypothetical protein
MVSSGAAGGTAAGTAAIAQSGTRLMLALSQAGRAIADKKRVAWTAPATIVACVALGCAAAWAMRESDLLAQPAAKTERRPPKGDLASLANPKVLLASAHKATDENERERLLWSVFDVAGNNDEQIEPTLEATVELMSLYLDRGDFERLIEVAKWMTAPGNADDQRTYGLMLHGIVAARRGSWKEARTAFTNALAIDDDQKRGKRSGEHFNLAGVRALAHEFLPLVERMPEEAGEASRDSLKRLFWERFQAPVKRKRP